MAARAFYWLTERNEIQAEAFAKTVYCAFFVEDRDISNVETVLEVTAQLGIDRTALNKTLNTPAIKERLKTEINMAINTGVFDSPYILCDREAFFGADRLPQLTARLARKDF